MRWHPHLKFAMPGVVALFLAAVFHRFIPPGIRPYVFASVILTLLLGLLTGQFRHMAEQQKKDKQPQDHQQSASEQEGPTE